MGEYDVHGMSPSTPPAQYKGSSASAHSHTIAKVRPKIKIIHIIAPEIIKTDATNFRDLVQRLTGKQQTAAVDHSSVTVGVAPLPPVEEEWEEEAVKKRPALAADFVVQQENKRRKKIKFEVVKVEEGGLGGGDLDHGELWMDLNPGGFLSFLEEDVFPGMADPNFLLPLGSSRMDLVGEMCASYLV